MTDTFKQVGIMRLVTFAVLIIAVVAGEVRELWWLWLAYWLLAEAFGLVTDRLVYWQGRHIEAQGVDAARCGPEGARPAVSTTQVVRTS